MLPHGRFYSADATVVTAGVGEMVLSSKSDEVLATYSLGSCVALMLYDPVATVGGMIHCQLPLSRMDPEQAKSWPTRFTDTGVATLLQSLYDRGAMKQRLIAKAAGGASVQDLKDHFRIGERNIAVLRKILWKNDILIAGSDLGGNVSRSVYLVMTSGTCLMRSQGEITEL